MFLQPPQNCSVSKAPHRRRRTVPNLRRNNIDEIRKTILNKRRTLFAFLVRARSLALSSLKGMHGASLSTTTTQCAIDGDNDWSDTIIKRDFHYHFCINDWDFVCQKSKRVHLQCVRAFPSYNWTLWEQAENATQDFHEANTKNTH